MSQSKAMSFVEAVTNTLIGLAIAYFAQSWFLKVLGVHISDAQNWALVAFMTVVSILRSYVLRRMFNGGWRAALDRVLTCHERYRSGRRW